MHVICSILIIILLLQLTVLCVPPCGSSAGIEAIAPPNDKAHRSRLRGVLCRELSVAYIHIFKAGGSSLKEILCTLCRKNGFECIAMEDIFSRSLLLKVCDRVICTTFWREPVARFLSGYHEIMLRQHTKFLSTQRDKNATASENLLVNRAFGSKNLPLLDGAATAAQKLEHFMRFLKMAETRFFDRHIYPQVSFIQQGATTAPVMHTSFDRAKVLLTPLHCGRLMQCFNVSKCIVDQSLFTDVHPRNRKDSSYGLIQYDHSESSLPSQVLMRIAKLYYKDYSYFNIPRYQVNGSAIES